MSESMEDEFGIRKIYPTNTHPNRAKPWLMGRDDWLERKYNGVGDWNGCPISTDDIGDTIINFNTSSEKGRLPVLALRADEYPLSGDITVYVSMTNQSKLRKRGFMGTKNDWKNVEVTLYWKTFSTYNRPAESNGMGFSVRGGPHHSDTFMVGVPCNGTALYVGVNHGGYSSILKELGHPDYADSVFIQNLVTSDVMDRWIGMKGVFYNKVNGNPYIELWLDKKNDNNWERVLSYEDEGNWFLKPGVDNDCGGEKNEKVTWGGPGVIFKIMGLTRADLKWGSIREILPPEGWPIRYLLEARDVPFPYSMWSLAKEHGLTRPVSLRQLTEMEAELYPFL